MSRRQRFTRNFGRSDNVPLAPRTTIEWIRFEHATDPYGVFSYVSEAKEALSAPQVARIEEIIEWFNENLDAPEGGLNKERFWFRAEAEEHIALARELADLIRAAGIPIAERRTSRVPGKESWEDGEQVAVLTYRDTPRSRRGPP